MEPVIVETRELVVWTTSEMLVRHGDETATRFNRGTESAGIGIPSGLHGSRASLVADFVFSVRSAENLRARNKGNRKLTCTGLYSMIRLE